MKLDRFLTISGTVYPVVSERVVLGLNDPGRAQFCVLADAMSFTPFQGVAFDIGYSSEVALQRLFLGYIESVTPVDGQQCKLFCREMAAVLDMTLPLNLRHPTLWDVLEAVQAFSGLIFSVPDAVYAKTKIPHFANVGNGYQVLDSIGRVFQIPDYVYQQQGDGVLFLGSWSDSRWFDKYLSIDVSFFYEQLSSQSASIAAITALRPGVVVNGNRVTGVEFSGNLMTLSW